MKMKTFSKYLKQPVGNESKDYGKRYLDLGCGVFSMLDRYEKI